MHRLGSPAQIFFPPRRVDAESREEGWILAIVRSLTTTGPSANRVDLIVMGDGYTSSEIATTYESHISDLLAYLFNGTILTQPFARYRSFFNVHSIDVVSAESGADDPGTGIFRDTVLDASYRYDGVTDRLLSVDESTARAIENETLNGTGIGAEMRFVVVNHTKYGGGGGYYGVYAGGNGSARELALHEIGHSFAGLADEYTSGGAVAYTGPEPPKPNVTTDAGGAKWAEWIGYEQPGIGVIGAYEGAYYHETGVYRPSLNSKMRSLEQPFDAIAREQFILQFYQLVDPLDGHTENSTEKRNPTSLSVDVVDPDVVEVDWSVDGRAFAGLGETLTFVFDYFDFGTYTVRARAYDDTDWVRGDRTALEQTVTWTVINDTRLYGGSLNDTLVGNGLANDIQGRDGSDVLFGGAGADTLRGGVGDDTYHVDNPADVVTEDPGEGSDTIRTGISYTQPANVENLILEGSANLSGTGNALANIMTGTAGDNSLVGGGGDDRISGAGGGDVLYGGDGRDAVSGGADSDRVFGGAGLDTVRGGASNDVVVGGAGNDRVFGDAGNDRLTGGRGRDIETGGSGRDRFIFDDRDTGASRKTADYILDFRGGFGDRLDLRLIDANVKARGDQKFAFIGEADFTKVGQVRYEHTRTDTWILLNTDADASAEAVIRLKVVFEVSDGWLFL